MSERILIKFKASGDKKLQQSIIRLAAAQATLEGNTKQLQASLNRLVVGFGPVERKGRLLRNTFATLRSKMLLFSFFGIQVINISIILGGVLFLIKNTFGLLFKYSNK